MSGEPRSIGRYELIAPLGEGGMARVFLAVSRGPAGFNKLVVIKVVKPELLDQPDFTEMFFDEARLAARLNHPNVVQTYEVGADGAHHFLTMEFLEGQPLSRVIERLGRDGIPLPEHLWILTKVLAGLHYAHELCDFDGSPLNVVHRDVSPANVFVTYNGQVKLVDFGVAKATLALAVTQKGMFKGKFGYGAPEQMLEKPIDRRADLFAVGVMLWEALARKSLTKGRGLQPLVTARVSGLEPKIRDVAPEVDGQLAQICERAMALDPFDRYPTADAFRDDLEGYLDGWGQRVTSRDVAALISNAFETDRTEMRQSIEVSVRRPSTDLMGEAVPVTGTMEAKSFRGDSSAPRRSDEVAAASPEQGARAGMLSEASPTTKPSPGSPTAPESEEVETERFVRHQGPATPNTVGGVAMGEVATGEPAGEQETTKPSPVSPPALRRSSWLLTLAVVAVTGLLVGVGVVVAGGGGVWSTSGQADSPAPPSPVLPSQGVDPTARDSVSTGDAVTAGEGEDATVELFISVVPGDATVTLDGKQLAELPFRAQVPRELATHVVRAAADGFVSQERVVTFARNVRLEFELVPLSAAGRPGVGPPSTTSRPGTTIEPGADLRSGASSTTKPTRTIDEADPYAK